MATAIIPRRVFVHGTLRRGECNHHFLGAAPRLGICRTAARNTLVNLGWYPALIRGGRTAVTGEVYRLTRMLLIRLDRLEDCPREYRRDWIRTPWGRAWVYVYRLEPPQGARRIPGGDWRRATSAGPRRRGPRWSRYEVASQRRFYTASGEPTD